MTQEEMDYLKRAVAALEQGPRPMVQHKILRTMEQICKKIATEIESDLELEMDRVMSRNHLVDLLKK